MKVLCAIGRRREERGVRGGIITTGAVNVNLSRG
jgi:hypothetical protein